MKYLLLTLLPFTVWVSCSEPIELDLKDDHKRTLVVNGAITNQPGPQTIHLSATTEFYDISNNPVTGASVVVYENDSIAHAFTESEAGRFLSEESFSGSPNKQYRLVISNVDIDQNGENETYTASSTMPRLLEGDSIIVQYFDTWKTYLVRSWAKDPPETMDYYMFKVFINDTLVDDSLNEFFVTDDAFYNGQNIEGVQTGGVNPRHYTLKAGDVIKQELNSISKEYFVFLMEIRSASRGSNPLFSGPPANVYGNISNGAYGFFTAYPSSYTKYTMKEEDIVDEPF